MKKTLLLTVAVLLGSMGFAQVDCNIANMQGGAAGGFLNWELGQGGIFAFIDPADDYAIGEGCGASYPYTIDNVTFDLADASLFSEDFDGIGTFGYQINVYEVTGGDPCNAPGTMIGGSGTITVELTGAGFNPQNVPMGIDVNDAFFISYEPVSWTGAAAQVPSILWDDVARPLCLQQMTQDGGATWMDFTDFFTGGETGWADFNIFGTSDSGSAGECEAGTIVDTTPLSLCPTDEGTFSVGGTQEVPAGHGYALFFNPTTGTGALDGPFNLTGVTLPYTFDSDLGGLLSGGGFPPFEGEWEVYGRVYENPDSVETTMCSETADFILVDFLTADDPDCQGGGDEPCEDYAAGPWTDLNTAWDGAPCDDGDGCPFLEFTDFEVFESEAYVMDNIQMGGTYTFSHCNGPGAGSWIPEYTIIAPSDAVDAFGPGDGDGCSITWTASESGTYLIVINEAGACGVAGSTPNGYPALTCSGESVDCPGENEWCDEYAAGPWTDLNTAWDGAPCDDGDGCPFLEFTDFEVFESEAYVMDNIQMGGTYTFSHCNGPGAGSWIPEYTIIAPSDAVDAFGPGDGDGCSITWTASEEGTYLIVINEAGACGVAGSTPNGYPALTCSGESVDCPSENEWCDEYAAGPWTDLNTAWDGAPCDDGDGCPFLEFTDFEVFESEAYVMDNIQMGGTYTFSHCNGPGAGSWIPEYTIIAPSDAVDAFGPGDGDGCSITWTASESGTYLIVINEAGACGVAGSTPNGYPALTCSGEGVDCEPVVVPENDNCADAASVTPGTHDFTTENATTDGPDQPGSDCEAFGESNINQDVWYEYTATCNGIGSVSTCNTADFDTRIAIYPGGTCPPDGSALIACNDDGVDGNEEPCGGFTSVVEWDITQGDTYLIRIGGYDDTEEGSGTFDLLEDCTTSISDEPTANFSVFPNPNNGQFALEFAGKSGMAQIDVLDVSGKTVLSEQRMMTEGARMDIDLGNVNGLYFVRMTMDQDTKVLKVIVQ